MKRNLDMHHGGAANGAIDPVCGMTVDPEEARGRGLVVSRGDVEYFFCGRGCKLDFQEDPMRYLAPGYKRSM